MQRKSETGIGHPAKAPLAVKLLLSVSGLVVATTGTAAMAQAPAEEASVGIADIVVTANRREQKLQDVPIAISAITSQMAEQQGITGTAALQSVVPSLIIARQANLAQPYLRGLGSLSGNANAEPSVALYIDGVYFPSANANFFDFNNVERIEVLKGPQGTLFGRNATGGVIQIITKDPGSKPEADFKIGYGNYETVTANAYLSAPITDTLGANIAVLYKNQGKGWGKNIFTGEDIPTTKDFGVRGKIVWTPGDATTIRLSGDYSHNRNSAISGQNPRGTTNFLLEPFPGEYNTNDNWEQRSNVESGGVSLKVDHDFGPLQLMSLSAYRKTDGFWTLDQDLSSFAFLNAVLNQKSRMYSQELHLLSPSSSKLQWLVGGYYYNYIAGNYPQRLTGAFLGAPLGPPGIDLYSATKTTSFSAFAQGTYPITDQTNLTLGFRYTWEKVRYNGRTTIVGTDIPFNVPPLGISGDPVSSQTKADAPTFRISIDHKITPDIMVYASYNRGRKSGNYEIGHFNQSLAVDSYFEAEKLDAYEIGIKTELFDRRVRFNLGGFYYDFSNMQFQRIVSGSGLTFVAPNGAEMYGVEAELNGRVTDQLTLNGSVGYLHSKIRDFEGAPHSCLNTDTGRTDPAPAFVGDPDGSANSPTLADGATPNPLYDERGYFCNGANGLPDPDNLIIYNAEGNMTPNSPEWTVNAGFVYEIPSSAGVFSLAGNATYTSKRYFEIDNRVNNPSMWLFNASIMWTDPSDHLSVSLWGRNLSDKYYYTQYTGQANASDIAGPGSPREYGVTLGYRF